MCGMQGIWRVRLMVLLVVGPLLLAGCGGGGAPEFSRERATAGFSVTPIADAALGGSAARDLALELAPGADSCGTLAVEVRSAGGRDVRAAYFTLRYDATRYTWLRGTSGPALSNCAAAGQLLELYALRQPGVVECGLLVPDCARRTGSSSPGVLATLYFAPRPTPPCGKIACQPPDNAASKPTLDFNGSNTLQWRFYNQGDYNQNGTVGITDLTPLGIRFGQTVTYPGEVDTAQAVVDGNSNGIINIADVMPIGANFGKNAGRGWNIYACSTAADYPVNWNDLNGSAVFLDRVAVTAYDPSTAPATDRLLYMYTIATPVPGDVYWVRPLDNDGKEGMASNYVPAGNNSPYAVFTTHAGNGTGLAGIAPHCVYFDATPSFDPDGNPITSYAWDFESDGIVDDTTATPLHTFSAPGNYAVKLVVSDGTMPGEDVQTIVVGDQGAWHSLTVDAVEDAGRLCSLALIGGLPAIAFCRTAATQTYICYTRSSSLLGESGTWSAAEYAVTDDVQWLSLSEVNGQPAIAYYRASPAPALCYVFYNGAVWLPAMERDADGDAGKYCSLLLYDGRPAVAYYRRDTLGDGMLRLLRAGDAGGSVWPLGPALVDGGTGMDVGRYASALARDGAINAAYYDANLGQLRFAYPSNPLLASWTARVVDARTGLSISSKVSLDIADGNPCLAYLAGVGGGPPPPQELWFTRANDAIGSDWPGTYDTVSGVYGDELSLAIVDGQPAVALYTAGDLLYYRSSEFARFATPEVLPIDTDPLEDTGQYVDMTVIGGRPCIAYYEALNQDLRFACRY